MEFHADVHCEVNNPHEREIAFIVDVRVSSLRDIEYEIEPSIDVDNPHLTSYDDIPFLKRKFYTSQEHANFSARTIGGGDTKVHFKPGDEGYLPIFAYDTSGQLSKIEEPVIYKIEDKFGNTYLDKPEKIDELYDKVYGFPFQSPENENVYKFGEWKYYCRGGIKNQFFDREFTFTVNNKSEVNQDKNDTMIVTGTVNNLANNPQENIPVHIYILGRFYTPEIAKNELKVKTNENGRFEAAVPRGGRIKVRIPESSFEKIFSTDEKSLNINKAIKNSIAYRSGGDYSG